jgi:hypothetical protein
MVMASVLDKYEFYQNKGVVNGKIQLTGLTIVAKGPPHQPVGQITCSDPELLEQLVPLALLGAQHNTLVKEGGATA